MSTVSINLHIEADTLARAPCTKRAVEHALRRVGIPATVRPNGELRVDRGTMEATVCAERTSYRWWAEGVVSA